jgi:tetratricopeptide (TPR) repeat protein
MSRQPLAQTAAIALVVGFGAAALDAIYVKRETEDVPVARLTQNLERKAGEELRDAGVRVNLARLHGMAYALDSETAPVVKLGEREDVWYGFEPKIVPYRAEEKPRSPAAQAHLDEAIRWYEDALKIEPTNLTAQLGLGWSFEQKGQTQDAIGAYRKVIEAAWPDESLVTRAGLGKNFYTAEAARYLIPLLDPDRDRKEIADLQSRAAKLERLPRPITPLVVPLTASASPREIVDLDNAVAFDADGSGLVRSWTWISKDAAWLVHDPKRSGKIESALQLFGNVTFWLFWRNGFDALAALDDDRDGEIRERELEGLALWRDGNGDGVSAAGEVKPLAEHGIVSLRCRYEEGDGFLTAAVAPGGVGLIGGRRADLIDVILRPSVRVSDRSNPREGSDPSRTCCAPDRKQAASGREP